MPELDKIYNPKQVEDKIYKMWEDGGYFTGIIDPDKKPFTIVIPPPNVTGQLHLGHAFDNTIIDILIRFKRMQGYSALYVTGTDHAGIATQVKVEEELRNSEGLTRFDLGREKFVDRVWDWKHTYGSRIVTQLRKFGCSCDWSRERFTMDEGCSKAVREVFVSLYEKGLIYKGKRIINWCPDCTTALSDAEVEHEEREGKLYKLRYPIKSSSDSLVIATTRPETMLGDTGVAVHPEDERYKHLIGKVVVLPLVNREIPIVADDYVDMEFGTGCVKVTPAHDPNDFEIGGRHDLEQVLIMDDNGSIINSGKYDGLERYEARKKVLQDLEDLGLLVAIEDHNLSIGSCYRCGTVVEPIASEQWFVKMKPLADPAHEVVKTGTVKIVPERFTKIYTHWMENVRDWCISRQLWWGHRIPAWYCDSCNFITVSREDATKCEACGSESIIRDEDVLDTWFSSALWPFSTLGWPEKTPDFEYFYPNDVLSCGTDILFFWVARMIFSGLEFTKQAPFHTVLIHGMIRDDLGRTMSKSLGNGIDPLDVIDIYGADALRFYVVTGSSPGADMRYFPERCEAMRNFANKIWNASRFVMMNLTGFEPTETGKQETGKSGDENADNAGSENNRLLPKDLKLEDKWILSKLNTLAKEVTDNLDKYELGLAASKIYDFIWDSYCDWYIELTKPRLSVKSDEESGARTPADRNTDAIDTQKVLLYVLVEILTILHPFMPFITEEIYQALPVSKSQITNHKLQMMDTENNQTGAIAGSETTRESGHESSSKSSPLMTRMYTKFTEELHFPKEEADFESVMNAIRAVRARRAEMNVPPSRKSALTIVTDKPEVFEVGRAYIGRLAFASEVVITNEAPSDVSNMVSVVTNDARLFMPLAELVDIKAERERINREIKKAKDEFNKINQKLSNEQFTSKAPEKVVNAEREKLEKLQALLKNLEESLP